MRTLLNLVVFTIGLNLGGIANATLIDRGEGLIFDNVLNVTWLQDANYAKTSVYNADGLMTWGQAEAWVSALTVGGFSDWRLPTTLLPDPSCVSHGSFVTAENCTGSELGYLFYKTLGNYGASNAPDAFGLVNTGPFVNLIEGHGYWSDTEYAPNSIYAYYFHFASGFQAYSDKSNIHYALAVRDGDVLSVPEPATLALLLPGLGLIWLRFTARDLST